MPKLKEGRVYIAGEFDKETADAIKKLAKKEDRSVASLLRRDVEEYLKNRTLAEP